MPIWSTHHIIRRYSLLFTACGDINVSHWNRNVSLNWVSRCGSVLPAMNKWQKVVDGWQNAIIQWHGRCCGWRAVAGARIKRSNKKPNLSISVLGNLSNTCERGGLSCRIADTRSLHLTSASLISLNALWLSCAKRSRCPFVYYSAHWIYSSMASRLLDFASADRRQHCARRLPYVWTGNRSDCSRTARDGSHMRAIRFSNKKDGTFPCMESIESKCLKFIAKLNMHNCISMVTPSSPQLWVIPHCQISSL
jgi:hypothetical protein